MQYIGKHWNGLDYLCWPFHIHRYMFLLVNFNVIHFYSVCAMLQKMMDAARGLVAVNKGIVWGRKAI